jgi:hypothetical protein
MNTRKVTRWIPVHSHRSDQLGSWVPVFTHR